jgi:hypothetical protein
MSPEERDPAALAREYVALALRPQAHMVVASCEGAACATSTRITTEQHMATHDVVVGGARFCMWAVAHDGVEHWALSMEWLPNRAQEAALQDAFRQAVFRLTGARMIRSCRSLFLDRVMLHWRWHSDGTAPSQSTLKLEAGIFPVWEQAEYLAPSERARK